MKQWNQAVWTGNHTRNALLNTICKVVNSQSLAKQTSAKCNVLLLVFGRTYPCSIKKQDFCKTTVHINAQILRSILLSHWQKDQPSIPTLPFPILCTFTVQHTSRKTMDSVKARTHGNYNSHHHGIIWEPKNLWHFTPAKCSIVQSEVSRHSFCCTGQV